MSDGFVKLVESLQGDFALVAEFLEDPSSVISEYSLTTEEKQALLSRNFEALAEYCGSEEMAAGVLSGAHTPLCSNRTITQAI